MSFVFFFKQKTAYEMRISDWSSDVCSSDLVPLQRTRPSSLKSRRTFRASSRPIRRFLRSTTLRTVLLKSAISRRLVSLRSLKASHFPKFRSANKLSADIVCRGRASILQTQRVRWEGGSKSYNGGNRE